MTSEWDDTPWSGTTVLAEPKGWGLGNGAAKVVAKAATGWEQFAYSGATPIAALNRSPLKRMKEEQALYWNHPWVRVAETTVTRKVAGLPWHVEDGANDDEVEDQTPDPRLKAVRDLLEKPQAALPPRERQPGIDTWANLVKITSRHLGLCGLTHWYPDQVLNGIPLALMYINPARMYPQTTTNGQLVGWTLDPTDDYGHGGTFLERDEVLTFYLDPPDAGGLTSGLVQAAWLKAQITQYGDRHFLDTLDSGGRLAGLVTPKAGTLNDEEFSTANRELRAAQEAPDASKRLTIIRGPVEYHRTTGDNRELDLSAYAGMTRSDILTIWGVPDSQAAVPIAGGLNSGSTKQADEPVLMQGAVHDRVAIIGATVQLHLLDKWTAISPQLVIEEPTFDDDTPAYTLASLAKDQPLTRNERRAIIKLDPLPEYGPDGEPLGLAIDMGAMITVVGQGEEDERSTPGRFANAPQAAPPPKITVSPVPQIPAMNPMMPPAKAGLGNRPALIARFEPQLRKAVAQVLASQKADIAAKVRDKGSHIARKPTDKSVWWDEKRWDRALMDAVKRSVTGLAGTVTAKVAAGFTTAKADPFSDTVLQAILRSVGLRIAGINSTTRDLLADLIGKAFEQGLAPGEVAGLIEDATTFDEARAELIARTETALVYNEAALASYKEYGVTEVEAIDGDEDPECAERNGQVFSLEEAMDIEDHPNGTLDWLPVIA